MTRTIVLAYSGGLDTSIIVPWLREHYDARVICVAADIGQGADELRGVREKALASGAEECYIEDLREEFVSRRLVGQRLATMVANGFLIDLGGGYALSPKGRLTATVFSWIKGFWRLGTGG